VPIYTGFSTLGKNKKFRLYDFELAQQDLINHLHIRKGEKLMDPDFGTIIWGMLFETLTDEIKSAIKNDLDRIIKSDPRIIAENVVLTSYEHGIRVDLDLTYVPTNQTKTLQINFDKKLIT
jgi:phage baseplate assembly protein W